MSQTKTREHQAPNVFFLEELLCLQVVFRQYWCDIQKHKKRVVLQTRML
jgi:hypothetical protein